MCNATEKGTVQAQGGQFSICTENIQTVRVATQINTKQKKQATSLCHKKVPLNLCMKVQNRTKYSLLKKVCS